MVDPRPRLLALAVLALVLCVPASSRASQTGPAPERTGKEIFETACVSCHGPDGRGAPKASVGFDLELPDFTDCRFSTPERDGDWAGIIEHGGTLRAFDRKMPAFGDALTRAEITRAVGYLRSFCTDATWPRGDLNLPRPLVTEKAFPENEAVVTTTFAGSPSSVGNAFVYEHRIGARNQYEVVVPFNAQKGQSTGWEQGLGDVAVALKHVLFHSIERGSIVSAGGEVTFPTGKEELGLGEGFTIPEVFGVWSQILPRDGFLHVHAGLEFPYGREPAANEGYFRTAAGKTFTGNGGAGRAWSPMIELVAAHEFEAGVPTEWDLIPQMQVTLSRRGHVSVSGGVQFPLNERADRGTKVAVYLLWDWFDGGLFTGWK